MTDFTFSNNAMADDVRWWSPLFHSLPIQDLGDYAAHIETVILQQQSPNDQRSPWLILAPRGRRKAILNLASRHQGCVAIHRSIRNLRHQQSYRWLQVQSPWDDDARKVHKAQMPRLFRRHGRLACPYTAHRLLYRPASAAAPQQ